MYSTAAKVELSTLLFGPPNKLNELKIYEISKTKIV